MTRLFPHAREGRVEGGERRISRPREMHARSFEAAEVFHRAVAGGSVRIGNPAIGVIHRPIIDQINATPLWHRAWLSQRRWQRAQTLSSIIVGGLVLLKPRNSISSDGNPARRKEFGSCHRLTRTGLWSAALFRRSGLVFARKIACADTQSHTARVLRDELEHAASRPRPYAGCGGAAGKDT